MRRLSILSSGVPRVRHRQTLQSTSAELPLPGTLLINIVNCPASILRVATWGFSEMKWLCRKFLYKIVIIYRYTEWFCNKLAIPLECYFKMVTESLEDTILTHWLWIKYWTRISYIHSENQSEYSCSWLAICRWIISFLFCS